MKKLLSSLFFLSFGLFTHPTRGALMSNSEEKQSYDYKATYDYVKKGSKDFDEVTKNLFVEMAGENLDAVIDIYEKYDVDIDALDRGFGTALHNAVLGNRLDIAQFLVEKGAEINMVYKIGGIDTTVLYTAVSGGRLDVIQFLTERGAKINMVYGDSKTTVLHEAVSGGCFAIIRFLLKQGADLNAVDKFGKTVLHMASEEGDTKLADLLLEHKADIDASDNEKETALHKATKKDHNSMVRFLVKQGADMDMSCDFSIPRGNRVTSVFYGVTCVDIAGIKGDYRLVDYFLTNGAASYRVKFIDALAEGCLEEDDEETRIRMGVKIDPCEKINFEEMVKVLVKHKVRIRAIVMCPLIKYVKISFLKSLIEREKISGTIYPALFCFLERKMGLDFVRGLVDKKGFKLEEKLGESWAVQRYIKSVIDSNRIEVLKYLVSKNILEMNMHVEASRDYKSECNYTEYYKTLLSYAKGRRKKKIANFLSKNGAIDGNYSKEHSFFLVRM